MGLLLVEDGDLLGGRSLEADLDLTFGLETCSIEGEWCLNLGASDEDECLRFSLDFDTCLLIGFSFDDEAYLFLGFSLDEETFLFGFSLDEDTFLFLDPSLEEESFLFLGSSLEEETFLLLGP